MRAATLRSAWFQLASHTAFWCWIVAITTSRPGPISASISSMSASDAATEEPTKPTSSAPTPMIHTGGSNPAARHCRSTVVAPSGLSAGTRVPVPAQ